MSYPVSYFGLNNTLWEETAAISFLCILFSPWMLSGLYFVLPSFMTMRFGVHFFLFVLPCYMLCLIYLWILVIPIVLESSQALVFQFPFSILFSSPEALIGCKLNNFIIFSLFFDYSSKFISISLYFNPSDFLSETCIN